MKDYEIIIKNGERLIVVYPGCDPGKAQTLRGHYKIALVPENLSGNSLFGLTSPNLVSYGMGLHNQLTISSISPKKVLASVEKDLPTLDGGVIEQQELPVENPSGLDTQSLLAVLGKQLLTGDII